MGAVHVDRRDQAPATDHGAQDPCTVTRAVCLWIGHLVLGGVGTGGVALVGLCTRELSMDLASWPAHYHCALPSHDWRDREGQWGGWDRRGVGIWL